ncbi:ankyrin-2-like [Argiope bruennichi]|uniref:Alpha-latrotoxin n=1 Tax=Argiope bruennichi TaxID=94029 RepID=A0A8T0F3J2_ARGBR|nr:ankyrin-2-like [Argiope bruennichi]KAF8783488.1 Ankyrin-2 like protein [Argiope bruennichi]
MALDFRNCCLKNFNELLIYNLRQRNCNINMVKKLLAHKVDVNYKDCFLNTSLHYVVQNCSDKLDLIREILNMEGNPNAINAEGNSPLHLAVLKSNVHVILELIKFGGDVRLTNKRGNTPLHVAAMRGKPCIIETLLKSDTSLINCGNIRKNTPLHIAVIHGKPYAAEMLIRHEADINCSNIEGNTPLHMAIIHDKEDMVKTLIKSRADLDYSNKEGNTPLHLGVIHGKLNIIQSLLSCGANVGCMNAKGNTPLHLAATHNKFDIIEVLIKFKADVGCSNKDHLTPMHMATINGNCKIIRKLNDNGAPVYCTDAEGNTPLHLSVIHNRPNVIETLIVNGAEHICNKNGYTPVHLAVIDNKLNIVKMLLDFGADIDCRDAELNTPLHLASIYDKPDIVVKLIESGAKTDLVNQDSHTPVQVAALHGNVNLINVLFQNGVRVKLRNQGRRYISSFAQSLIQHSNAATQAATSNHSESGTAGGGTGASQSATQNNSAINSGSQSSSSSTYTQFLSVSSPIHSVAPAGHPVTTFTISAGSAGPSTGPPPSAQEASSLIQEMQQILHIPPPGMPENFLPVSGTLSQSANATSTPQVGNTSSVSSQTIESVVSSTQGSNQSSDHSENIEVNPVQDNLLPVVAQTISEIANSMSSLGGLIPSSPPPQESFVSSTGVSSANAFADLIFETEQAYVLGPITIAQPPSLAAVQAWTLANVGGNHGAVGSSQSGASTNFPQQVQNTYAAFLDELDSEGDPMSWSWSPFLRSSRVEETAIIDNLVKFYGINGRNRSGNEYLQRALINDNPNEIASLLRYGTGNVCKANRRENSFLHLAAVYGKPKLVKALIQSGVAVDSKNNEMNTPLHFAAFCGEAEVINILVQSGANMDLMNRRGATPLKYAFGYCRESVLKNLGKFGANRFLLSAKTLVKYDVLKKGLYLTRHKVLKANCVFELLNFVEECCDEALCMKQKILGKNFSFYQFVNQALSNSESLSQSPYVENAVEYLIEISSKTEYTIYYDILVYLIATRLEKSFWKKKLLDLVDNAVKEGKICLNRKLFSSICNYVCNVDIFNLLLAFTDNECKHYD